MKRRFLWWLRTDPQLLEDAKRAEVEADARLRESKVNARWARAAIDRDGFAEALVHIMQGGAS